MGTNGDVNKRLGKWCKERVHRVQSFTSNAEKVMFTEGKEIGKFDRLAIEMYYIICRLQGCLIFAFSLRVIMLILVLRMCSTILEGQRLRLAVVLDGSFYTTNEKRGEVTWYRSTKIKNTSY